MVRGLGVTARVGIALCHENLRAVLSLLGQGAGSH